jgi:hypothetical protein
LEHESSNHWTVGAAFTSGLVITAGSRLVIPKFLWAGDYRIQERCDDAKHERELERLAAAEPTYMKPDDPRALYCRRLLAQNAMSAEEAWSLIQEDYLGLIDSLAEDIEDDVREGDLDIFRLLSHRVEEVVGVSEYTFKAHKSAELLRLSPHGKKVLEGLDGEVLHIGSAASRCMVKDLVDALAERDIHMNDPKTIRKYKELHEDED